ncbi:alpha/beta hydrolase [Hamadaea tsunoensis]|uniref:alpha/beta hydrolase n=1 Tax=Hamadaea tsunoensis TaxID=53368 RepID=UPI0003F6B377|nr:alpha/beta hydrolase-fold protein [Hamadaea tsunoensis]
MDHLLVLLHGYGDDPDGLAWLADELSEPGRRVLIPPAPLPSPVGGRAWWFFDPADRPAWAWPGPVPPDYTGHRLVGAARAEVLALIAEHTAEHAGGPVTVAGFSQGAMLALDVAVTPGSGVTKVAALSGVMIADTLPNLGTGTRPAALVAHGVHDDQLPFAAGEGTRDLLAEHGFDVEWLPFAGGHEIPDEVIAALRRFLAG